MHKLAKFIAPFCNVLKIRQDELLSPKRTSDVVGYRYLLTAVYFKSEYPELLKDTKMIHPEGLLDEMCKGFKKSKGGCFKISKNTRFFYKTYSDFRNQVDDINNQLHAIGH